LQKVFSKQSKSSNIFNKILSVFSSAGCFCEREKFSDFFGTTQIRWRQLSWASIAVRENCLESSQVFSNDPENELQIKGNSKIFGPWLLRQNYWAWPIVSLRLVLSYFLASDSQLCWLTGPYFLWAI
jgi:hypothetical protein